MEPGRACSTGARNPWRINSVARESRESTRMKRRRTPELARVQGHIAASPQGEHAALPNWFIRVDPCDPWFQLLFWAHGFILGVFAKPVFVGQRACSRSGSARKRLPTRPADSYFANTP